MNYCKDCAFFDDDGGSIGGPSWWAFGRCSLAASANGDPVGVQVSWRGDEVEASGEPKVTGVVPPMVAVDFQCYKAILRVAPDHGCNAWREGRQ